MPADVRSFTGEPPALAVVDSSFFFQALIDPREPDGRHAACFAFLNRLRQRDTLLVVSPLLFVEAPQCWRRLYRRGVLAASSPETDEAASRVNAFVEANARLHGMLQGLRTFRARFTAELTDIATVVTAQYNLNAHDALHVALARDLEIADLVTADRDFNRVDDLVVWRPGV